MWCGRISRNDYFGQPLIWKWICWIKLCKFNEINLKSALTLTVEWFRRIFSLFVDCLKRTSYIGCLIPRFEFCFIRNDTNNFLLLLISFSFNFQIVSQLVCESWSTPWSDTTRRFNTKSIGIWVRIEKSLICHSFDFWWKKKLVFVSHFVQRIGCSTNRYTKCWCPNTRQIISMGLNEHAD